MLSPKSTITPISDPILSTTPTVLSTPVTLSLLLTAILPILATIFQSFRTLEINLIKQAKLVQKKIYVKTFITKCIRAFIRWGLWDFRLRKKTINYPSRFANLIIFLQIITLVLWKCPWTSKIVSSQNILNFTNFLLKMNTRFHYREVSKNVKRKLR